LATHEARDLTIGCTATDFPPLRGYKTARVPGVKAKKLSRGTKRPSVSKSGDTRTRGFFHESPEN